MPRRKLDRETLRKLLQKADEKWFITHSGKFNYQEHLDFTTHYIVKHYKEKDHA